MAAGGSERPEAGGNALDGESLAEVLASIRALVSAETEARVAEPGQGDTVLMLTPDMRLEGGRPARSGEMLAEGIEGGAAPAPALDEQALRELINSIVREELQGELGDRIGRNLRKLIRREIAQILEEQRQS
jgi:hypothetical protein